MILERFLTKFGEVYKISQSNASRLNKHGINETNLKDLIQIVCFYSLPKYGCQSISFGALATLRFKMGVVFRSKIFSSTHPDAKLLGMT